MMRRNSQTATEPHLELRTRLYVSVVAIIFFIIVSRLFYWQVVKGSDLRAEAEDQYKRSLTKTGSRGTIFTSDGKALVTNKRVYRLFAQPQQLNQEPSHVAKLLTDLVKADHRPFQDASTSADKSAAESNLELDLIAKLSKQESKWVSLHMGISEITRQAIIDLNLKGVGFDAYETREYPEASMAAHLTGFVGKNSEGEDTGYFGIEGALDQELKGRLLTTTVMTDALGQQLTSEQQNTKADLNGRNVTLTIRRDLQHLAETKLQQGMQKYGAQSGEIIIMDPKTGKFLAMAAQPSYYQSRFFAFDASLYQNPSLSSVYEPGSTFKLLTVAAGLDAGLISPDTVCTKCSGPRVFGQYTIKTWNDQYTPNITMSEALAKSDNTAMIFIAEMLGAERLKTYIEQFGIGQPLNIDLQGDLSTPFPQKWGPVELATISFGQGISTTSLQLMRAVATIANDGVMMRPLIVESVTDQSHSTSITSEVIKERQVISKQSADTLTRMMIEAAQRGEAQWTDSKTHTIAGKTGTSQVAARGGYDSEQTIASYIGFAPPDNPQFVMLVKLVGPTSSIWAAETAAPLWYSTAESVFLMLNIPPDR